MREGVGVERLEEDIYFLKRGLAFLKKFFVNIYFAVVCLDPKYTIYILEINVLRKR